MIPTKTLNASVEKDILIAAELIKKGELVAVPTETVYGLAADARNIDAVKNIFIVKNRPSQHPVIVHIGAPEKIYEWAQDVPDVAVKLAEKFWPGPLTLLLKKRTEVDNCLTGGLETIAIRMPNNAALLKIISLLNTGLAAPSANPHKKISPTTAAHVIAGLNGKIAAVLDDGPCTLGLESTILDLTQATPRILRPGPITKKMLEAILQRPVDAQLSHTEKVPGNMKIHYSPHTESLLMSLDEIYTYLDNSQNTKKCFAIMPYTSDFKSQRKHDVIKQMPQKKEYYAQELYQALHELDAMNVDQILVEQPPQTPDWADIFDRLSKACAR